MDWGSIFGDALDALRDMFKVDLGEALQGNSDKVADGVADYTSEEWLTIFGQLYPLLALIALLALLPLGGKMMFSSRQLPEGTRQQLFHPFQFILIGILVPAVLTVWNMFIDLLRQLCDNIADEILGEDWSDNFEVIQITLSGHSVIDFLITWGVNGFLGWLGTKEVEWMRMSAYFTPFAVLVGYAIMHYHREFGSRVVQFFAAIFFGFSLAIPVLVIVYGAGAFAVGFSPLKGLDITIALVTAFAAAAIPLLLSLWFYKSVQFAQLIGGQATMDGKTDSRIDPDSDKPLEVKIKEDVKVRNGSMAEVTLNDLDGTQQPSMEPRVVADDQTSSGRLIDDYSLVYTSAGPPEEDDTPAEAPRELPAQERS